MAFDYFIDSEFGYDKLMVWLDSEIGPRFVVSGTDARRKVITGIPAGQHTVRFEYKKDQSITVGSDMAWVDNITAFDSGGRKFFDRCKDVWTVPTPPQGWTGSGHASGWVVVEPAPDRAAQRPSSQYHQASSTSWMSRSVSLPPGVSRDLEVDYYVDSEANDIFFVMVNGQVVLRTSGRERSGTARTGLSTGNNIILIGYVKDGTQDAGLDLASVDEVRLVGGGRPSEVLASFDGLLPFSTQLPGWTTGGSQPSFLWQVRPKAPHVSRVSTTLKGEPSIDGEASGLEYGPDLTEVALFRHKRSGLQIPTPWPKTDASSKLTLKVDEQHNSLYVLLRAKARTDALGDEEGEVHLYLDMQRARSLAHLGCDEDIRLPDQQDQRIQLRYAIPANTRRIQAEVMQWRGTCNSSSPWSSVPVGHYWGVEAMAAESNEGEVLVEAKIVVPGDKLTAEPVGVGVDARTPRFSMGGGIWYPRTPPDTIAQLPYLSGNQPDPEDVLTWETIAFGPWQLSDSVLDGCCGPRPVK